MIGLEYRLRELFQRSGTPARVARPTMQDSYARYCSEMRRMPASSKIRTIKVHGSSFCKIIADPKLQAHKASCRSLEFKSPAYYDVGQDVPGYIFLRTGGIQCMIGLIGTCKRIISGLLHFDSALHSFKDRSSLSSCNYGTLRH